MRRPLIVPDPEVILADLAPVIPAIYEAAEVGTQEARDYFAQKGRVINLDLAPGLFRYAAKEFLTGQGRDVAVEEYGVGALSQNGLLLTFEQYRIRILKADQRSTAGGLPPPGESEAKADYYQQRALPLLRPDGTAVPVTNLVVLWRVNREYELLAELSLVCPRGLRDTLRGKAVDIYFDVPMPRPAVTAPVVDLTDEAPTDLDIGRDVPAAGGSDLGVGNDEDSDGGNDA